MRFGPTLKKVVLPEAGGSEGPKCRRCKSPDVASEALLD